MAMPEYFSDYDQANGHLRIVLSLLGKHKIPPNIINLTLLYEYVTANNQTLNDELEKLFSNPALYSKEQASLLYKQFIWDDEKSSSDALNNILTSHLKHALLNIKKVYRETSKTCDNFEEYSSKLRVDEQVELTASELKAIVKALVLEANNALTTNKSFKHDLKKQQTELEKVKTELAISQELANQDPLTNLFNRRAFDRALSSHITFAKESSKPLSLIIIDIDFFKKVNDKHGHLIGDKVICFIASVLSDGVRKSDIVARIGGEEYAIILADTQLNNASFVAENLRETVQNSRLTIPKTKQKLEQVTISLGLTSYRAGEAIEKFMSRADRALYMSKTSGRNKVTKINDF